MVIIVLINSLSLFCILFVKNDFKVFTFIRPVVNFLPFASRIQLLRQLFVTCYWLFFLTDMAKKLEAFLSWCKLTTNAMETFE